MEVETAIAESRRGHRRASRPSTPSGATHRITSSAAPKKSSRYSARPERSSGRTTLTNAPTTGPKVQPAPPTMTANRNRIDCENGNESGATNISSGAKIPPARPVKTAERENAAVLTITGLRPIERAAGSASRTATIAMPQPLRARRWNA